MISLFWYIETISSYITFLSILSDVTVNTHLLSFVLQVTYKKFSRTMIIE